MIKSRKYRKKMRGGFYTNTSNTSPTTNTSNTSPASNTSNTNNTSNSIMGFFNDAWEKTKETSQSMLSNMNKPKTTTTTSSQPITTSSPSTITGGKRSRRKKGGYYTTRPFTGAPVDHIKMAKPTYWIKGGRTRNKKRRNLKTRCKSRR